MQEYAKLTPNSAEGRTVATMTDVFSDIQDLFIEALDDASTNFQKAEKNTATNDGVKESKRLGGYFPKIEVSTNDISIFNIDDINDLKEVKEKTFNYLLGKYVSNDKISKPIKNIDTDMEIYVYRGGINETFGKAKAYKNLSNKKKKIKLATMTSLAKLIKYGEVRSEDASNYHNVNSGSVFAYLTAPISVDGVNYTVNMDIKKTPDGNRFYIHTIKIADEAPIQDEKVTLTLGEILSLYAYSKRDQAIPHLESGGFVQVEPVKKKIGGKINIEYTVYEDHAHRISEVELGSIINILTKEQIAFADVMQEYLSTVMGAKGNEISRELYQIDLFKEKFYFPLKLSSVYKYFKKNENSKTPVLKNAGMTKPTVTNANDPIVLESFENVWANHVVQMSRYNAYVLGIENLTKVFGYTGIDKSSVRAALQGTYGDAAIKYLENFIIDLNGGRKR